MRVDGRNPTCFLFTSKQMDFNAMVYLKKKKKNFKGYNNMSARKILSADTFYHMPLLNQYEKTTYRRIQRDE